MPAKKTRTKKAAAAPTTSTPRKAKPVPVSRKSTVSHQVEAPIDCDTYSVTVHCIENSITIGPNGAKQTATGTYCKTVFVSTPAGTAFAADDHKAALRSALYGHLAQPQLVEISIHSVTLMNERDADGTPTVASTFIQA